MKVNLMLSVIDVSKFLKGLRTEVEIYVKILVIEPRGALKLSQNFPMIDRPKKFISGMFQSL